MKNGFCFLQILLIGVIGCSKDDTSVEKKPVEYSFDFASGTQEWVGDFADYPVGAESSYELGFNHSILPLPLDQNKNSLRQSGNNHSDDLFMFIKHKITGLAANQTYQVTFNIQIATNAHDYSVGVGGSPANDVTVKAGMTQKEPVKEADEMGYYRMNIDKSNQGTGGADMVVIGDCANGTDEDIYTLKDLCNKDPFQVKTDKNGELWTVIGTDSGFEGITTIFYNKISIKLE